MFYTLRFAGCCLLACMLSSCFKPPYNNFQTYNQSPRATSGNLTAGISHGSKNRLIKALQKQDIQFVQYGDTMTLVVPTDKYFLFMSPRLNELCYPGLNNIVRLVKQYPASPIYVAAFTDNVGSKKHKKLLSQAQAETMLTFLWANNIPAMHLKAEGYGDKNPISDNALIHGSAQNRRIEIQWFTGLVAQASAPVFYTK